MKIESGKIVFTEKEYATIIQARDLLSEAQNQLEKDKSCDPLGTRGVKRAVKPGDGEKIITKIMSEYVAKPKFAGSSDGQNVQIIDEGKSYTTYYEWMEKNIETPEERCKYDYGMMPPNGAKGWIIAKAPHGYREDVNLCCVNINGRYYIIEDCGLRIIK